MKILLTSLNFDPEETGIGPYTGAFARWLADSGTDNVNVIAAHPHYPEWAIADGYGAWKKVESSPGLHVTRLRHWVPRGPSLFLRMLSEMSFAVRLLFTSWPQCDVILAVSPSLMGSLATLAKARVMRQPVLVWVQDLYGRGVAQRRFGARIFGIAIRWAERTLLRNSAHVVTIHERFSEAITSDYGISPSKISVVRNWSRINTSEFSEGTAFRRQHGLGGRLIVLHVGAQGQKQGLAEIVPELKRVNKVLPELAWVFVGAGNERQKLQNAVECDDSFLLIGHLGESDFAEVLAAADIFLLSEAKGSGSAAVPSKLTTYFASGSPVLGILNEDSIAASEIQFAGAGIVASHDWLEIANALRDLSSPSDRARLAHAGSKFAATHLDEHSCCDRLRIALSTVARSAGRHGSNA